MFPILVRLNWYKQSEHMFAAICAVLISFVVIYYLNRRYSVLKDLIRCKQLLSVCFLWWLAQKLNRVSSFNNFEHLAKVQMHHPFLKYIEPQPNSEHKPLEERFIVRTLSYRQTLVLCQKFSAYLASDLHVQAGDTVAMYYTNNLEFIIIWLALWNLGAIPAMINYNLEGDSLQHCVEISSCKLLLVDPEVCGNVVPSVSYFQSKNINTIVLSQDKFDYAYHNFGMHPYVNTSPKISDAACYIFTSGTSGFPKAAGVSWKKCHWGPLLYATVGKFSKDDTLYSSMPLYHSTAAILGFLSILHVGGTYAIGHKFSASTFWTQVMLAKATSIQYVGEVCRYLLNSPIGPHEKSHSVKIAHGNGLRSDIWIDFKKRFNIPTINEFYAATECPFSITNMQEGDYAVGACGSYGALATMILRNTRWNIAAVDPNTLDLFRDAVTGVGKSVTPNVPGEIVFKITGNVTKEYQGYAGNTAASDEKIARNVFKKGDTWIRSGDLAKFDDDYNVYFVDRLGDTFRWKSENVSTNEVEEVLGKFPGVAVPVCVGIKVLNHEGRAGFAVLKLSDEQDESNFDFQGFASHVKRRLPKYAVPIFLKIVSNIPTTGSNKILKRVFRDQELPPSDHEVLYWLKGDSYTVLTTEDWLHIENGELRL